MGLLIKKGRVYNPSTDLEKELDIYMEDGKVMKIAEEITCETDQIIDATGCWVTPGLIDVHVHLREPGYAYKETIQTGSESAAAGGFTTICAMPNTKPALDTPDRIQQVIHKAEAVSKVHVLPIGAITLGQEGEELVDIKGLAKAGACALSEDGKSVMNAATLRDAMLKAKEVDLTILSHCEDIDLAKGGCMHLGKRSKELGLPGISAEAEEIIVARDIMLGKLTEAKVHLCHISTKGSISLLRQAKEAGIQVTAEVCPHHFTLTEDAVDGVDTNMKMSPPLRSKGDIEAIKKAFAEGIIDIIATDHAPHSEEDKAGGFLAAANGILGLETAVPLGITELVHSGILTPMAFIKTLTSNPAKMLGIEAGHIEEGKVADITIIDPNRTYKIDCQTCHSKSKNSPFHGREVTGKVTHTIVDGQVVYQA